MAVVSFSAFPGDPRPRRAAEALAAAGMQVEVICLRDEGSSKRESIAGIEVDRVSIRKSRSSKLWYILQYCLFLTIVFLKLTGRSFTRRYDIVHVHNMPDVLVFAAIVPKLLGAKVILDLHDPMPELMMTIFGSQRESRVVRWMTRLERWSIAFADTVITVNRACEKLFAERVGQSEDIHVVMNSPDESIFRFVPVQEDVKRNANESKPFVLMYHGTIVERNGLDLVVEAVAKLRQTVPAVQLRIYGARTPFLDEVMQYVAAERLDDHVTHHGHKRLEDLSVAISECDAGVIPNKRSIFTEINTPTRIFEYLALGKPVVAPRSGGITDYFDDDALIYFELGDAGQLAERLAWVANNPAEVSDIVRRGQDVYLDHAWSEEKARLLSLVTSLLRDKNASPDRQPEKND